jgi:prepilin-type processing-associated H-X9-DG protein
VLSSRYRYLGKTNYAGVAGCGTGTHPFFNQYQGIFTNRVQISLRQIVNFDGSSNTLLYGEGCGSHWGSSPSNSMDLSWMGAGALATYPGLRRGAEAEVIAFSSFHNAGVQFCFADGSVRIVRFGNTSWNGGIGTFSPDWYLLQQLAGFRDGQSADVSTLVD